MADLTEREQDIMRLAWQLGYDHAIARMAEAADDIGRTLVPPLRSHEQRVADRMAEFDAYAARVRDDLDRYRAHEIERDRAAIATGMRYAPLTWDAIKAWVTPDVWRRIRHEWQPVEVAQRVGA